MLPIVKAGKRHRSPETEMTIKDLANKISKTFYQY
jgi:hypothetical protein